MPDTTPEDAPVRVLGIGPDDGRTDDLAGLLSDGGTRTRVVRTVSGTAAALDTLADGGVDCVVCRHDPPDVDGSEVIGTLREAYPGLPVVVLTAPADAAGLLDAGATDVVQTVDDGPTGRLLASRIETAVERANGEVRSGDGGEDDREDGDLFDALSTALPHYAFVYDRNGRYLDVLSGQWSDEALFPTGELLGASVDDVLGDAAAATIREGIDRALETGEVVPVEYRVDADRTRWFEGRLVPLAAPYDDRDGVLLAARETTDSREREVQRTRNSLNRLLERLEDAFFAVDDGWEVTYANTAGKAVLRDAMGIDEGDVEGRHLWESVPDAVDTAFYDRYHEAMRTQEPTTFEEYYEPMDVWFEVRAYPDEDGLSVFFSDVTEHRERARELERYETILESLDDAVYAVDDDGTITYVNERYASMKGVDRSELLGTDIYDWVDDETAARAASRRRSLAAEDRDVATLEYEFRSVDGETTPAEMRFTRLGDDDGDAGRVGVIRDVGERRERERDLERYRTLTQTLSDVVITVDEDGVVQAVNPAVGEVLGYDPDDVVGESLTAIMPSRFVDSHESAFERYLDTAERRLDWDYIELPARHADGHEVPLAISFSEYEHEGERYLTGVLRDITDRRERERALNDLLDAAQRFIVADDEGEIVDEIADAVETAYGNEHWVIRLHDTDAGTLPVTRLSDAAADLVGGLPTVPDDEGLAGQVFQSGEPRVIDDLSGVADVDYGPYDSAMVLPLGDHGTLGIGALEPDAFDAEDRALIELLTLTAEAAFDRLDRERDLRSLQRVVEHVDEMVFLLDADGGFRFVTDRFLDYLGRDRAWAANATLDDVVTPRDRETLAERLSRVRNATDVESATFEVDLRAGDGTVLPVELELSSTGDADVAGAVTDISELAATRTSLETERDRFRELFENLPEPAVEVEFHDGAPLLRHANAAFVDVFGYDPDAIEGENLNEYIVPEDDRSAAATLDERTESGEDLSVDVQRLTRRGRRDFLLRGTTYTGGGRTFGLAIYTDVTDQRERQRYLEVLNRVIRHNLRNEMTVVVGLARQLAAGLSDPEREADARTLLESAEDVAALGEKAKQLERVVGRRDHETAAVDVVPALRAVADRYREHYPDATLRADLPDELWVQAGDDVERAVAELVENAIRHGGATPTVTVGTREVAGDPDRVELRIADDGGGIPDEEWGLIAGETDISQLTHGSGLGLWLTRWIIESFGGEVRREEAEDGGTTVVLELRRAAPPAARTSGGEQGARRGRDVGGTRERADEGTRRGRDRDRETERRHGRDEDPDQPDPAA